MFTRAHHWSGSKKLRTLNYALLVPIVSFLGKWSLPRYTTDYKYRAQLAQTHSETGHCNFIANLRR
jgi:hypothetical protein